MVMSYVEHIFSNFQFTEDIYSNLRMASIIRRLSESTALIFWLPTRFTSTRSSSRPDSLCVTAGSIRNQTTEVWANVSYRELRCRFGQSGRLDICTYRTFQNFLSLRVCVEHSNMLEIASVLLSSSEGMFATTLEAARADICRTAVINMILWFPNISW